MTLQEQQTLKVRLSWILTNNSKNESLFSDLRKKEDQELLFALAEKARKEEIEALIQKQKAARSEQNRLDECEMLEKGYFKAIKGFTSKKKEEIKTKISNYHHDHYAESLVFSHLDDEGNRVYTLPSYSDFEIATFYLFGSDRYGIKAVADPYETSLDQGTIIETCLRMKSSLYRRRLRLEKRVQRILENYSVFLTLTFKPETFETTSKETRRRYVIAFADRFYNDYVANIDYGDENGREHYHLIGNPKQRNNVGLDYWASEKEYGYFLYKPIKRNKKSKKCLTEYITKLTSHALKESTKLNYLIYPRKQNKMDLS